MARGVCTWRWARQRQRQLRASADRRPHANPLHARFSRSHLAKVLAAGLGLWLLVMATLVATNGLHGTLTQMGWFFTKAALLTFGGAYAVLPYVYQGAVETHQWLSGPQMIDGLALGETTPGPLIMVVAFVGFVGGWLKQILGPDALFFGGAVKRLNAIRAQLTETSFATAAGYQLNGLKREELIATNSMLLHELYFGRLGGDGTTMEPAMKLALDANFGSVERWREEFIAMGKALSGGSGWALLVFQPREGSLVNQWAAELPDDRDLVVCCVRGHEVSRAIAMRLRAAGLNPRYLRGGIDGWEAAGRPLVEKPAPSTP